LTKGLKKPPVQGLDIYRQGV